MQRFRASRRHRASYVRDTFKLDDPSNKDLHFLVGPETVSCHQSMLIPYSKFLRSLLRDRISRAGVPDITIILPDVKMNTVKSLLEYIYTGKTKINKIKEVNEIDSLRRLLQMKISIDKKIYPLDKQKNTSKPQAEDKPNLTVPVPEVKTRETICPPDKKTNQLPIEEKSQVKEPSPRKSAEKVVLKAEEEPVAPIIIKKEKGLNTSCEEENAQKDPYSLLVKPLKLKVKKESPPESDQTGEETNNLLGGSSSMFERILKSISGENEGGEEEEEEESSSDSDSSDSDGSSSDSDSEEDSVPQLPVEGEDGVPSINTSLLMLELSKDEERLHKTIQDFMSGGCQEPGTCGECGHQLTLDSFVLHHSIHLEDVKQAKLKLLYSADKRSEDDDNEAAEEARMEWASVEPKKEQKEEQEQEQEVPASGRLPPTPPPEKESVEAEIDKLQQDQRRISQGIISFMEKMQRGTKQVDCSECEDSLTIINLVSHFQKHIQDLHEQIETLMKKKSDNKRKLEPKKETPRKKLKESRPTPPKTKTIISEENKERLGSDEERKKMYKRIYGRKKYQYKINRRAEDVKVTEEEIDAEIAKEKAKYSGQPLLAGDPAETANLSPGELLRSFVQFGSKEYKHEFKKARDRLYKRKLRVLRMKGIMDNTAALDIPRSDIEVEMLSRYSANRTVKTEDKLDGELVQEASEDQKNVNVLEDLELSLDVDDVGELFKGAETIMGDTSMATLVSEITDENTMQSILTDIVVKTTLEEGVQSQIIL